MGVVGDVEGDQRSRKRGWEVREEGVEVGFESQVFDMRREWGERRGENGGVTEYESVHCFW